jgi:hypothetical protein
MTTRAAGKTIGQINADHEAYLDEQPMTVRCAFCPWSYEGTVADGRLEGERHRQAEHPDRAPGGQLAEGFEKRRRRRTPWPLDEVLEAFVRFHREHDRWPADPDVPLVPYLPSVHTVMKHGGWLALRKLAEALRADLSQPPPPAATDPPDPTDGAERPAGRDGDTVSRPSDERLRAALHELVDAVIEYLRST